MAQYSPVSKQSTTLSNLSKAIAKLDKMLEKPDDYHYT